MSFGSKAVLQIYFFCKRIERFFRFAARRRRDFFARISLFMASFRMINFCKHQNCPSSEKLLAFQKGESRKTFGEYIQRHLAECEFCTAEVEFYSRYPQSDEPVASADIPPNLFELAKALLGNKHKDFNSLNKLLSETETKNLVRI